MMEPRREVTVRLTNAQYERLRLATFRLRVTKQQAIIEAIEMWLAAEINRRKKDTRTNARTNIDN